VKEPKPYSISHWDGLPDCVQLRSAEEGMMFVDVGVVGARQVGGVVKVFLTVQPLVSLGPQIERTKKLYPVLAFKPESV
jgi:hypothetical protein